MVDRNVRRRRRTSRSRTRRRLFPLLGVCVGISCCQIVEVVDASLCQQLEENTFSAFVEAIEDSPEFVIFCPFHIHGNNGCRAPPKGYVVAQNTSLTILCDHIAFGGGPMLPVTREVPVTSMNCILDCPSTHFTVEANAKLTLDSIALRGSTRSSVVLEVSGELHAFGSKFENHHNEYGNGGAIQAGENARLITNQCEFINNTSLNGGAIFVEGESFISNSLFVSNEALAITPMAGGGAIAIGVFAETTITGCEFEGNKAASQKGEAVLDHSNGTNTRSQANNGCNTNNMPDTDTDTEVEVIIEPACNGVERSSLAGTELDSCQEFESTCAISAHESTSNASPTGIPSPAPSSRPNTFMPTIDPCRDDKDSFECVLHELLEGIP